MNSRYPDLFAALAQPFAPDQIRERPGQGGKMLSYIERETVMDRLNEVVGPENWDYELKPWGADLIGTLTITLPDGSKVKRCSVGGRAGMQMPDDDAKSADTDCLKRCGTLFGISALAGGSHADRGDRGYANGLAPRDGSGGQKWDTLPRTGRALFSWSKDQGQKFGVDVIKYITGWGMSQGFSERLIDWNDDQAQAGVAEAVRKLRSVGYNGPAPGEQPAPTTAPGPDQSDGFPAPRRQPSQGELTMQENILPIQRNKLVNLLWSIARRNAGVRSGAPNPHEDWFWRAYEAVLNSEAVGSTIIPRDDINACTDTALLGRWIEGAEEEAKLPSHF